MEVNPCAIDMNLDNSPGGAGDKTLNKSDFIKKESMMTASNWNMGCCVAIVQVQEKSWLWGESAIVGEIKSW